MSNFIINPYRFAATEQTYEIVFDPDDGSGTAIDGNPTRFGQKFDSEITNVTSIKFACEKSGTPPDNMTCFIYNADESAKQEAEEQILASSLPASWGSGSPTYTEYTFDPACTIPAGGFFAVQKETGTWSSPNRVNVNRSDSSQRSGTNVIKYTSGGAWVEETAQDMNIIITYS